MTRVCKCLIYRRWGWNVGEGLRENFDIQISSQMYCILQRPWFSFRIICFKKPLPDTFNFFGEHAHFVLDALGYSKIYCGASAVRNPCFSDDCVLKVYMYLKDFTLCSLIQICVNPLCGRYLYDNKGFTVHVSPEIAARFLMRRQTIITRSLTVHITVN